MTLTFSEELSDLAKKADEESKKRNSIDPFLDRLEKVATEIGKSWSGSFLGYHSTVYHEGFRQPPAGVRFSRLYGFDSGWRSDGTIGNWAEQPFDAVIDDILLRAEISDMGSLLEVASFARNEFGELRSISVSSLTRAIAIFPHDAFLVGILKDIENLRIGSDSEFREGMLPSGQFQSMDIEALTGGIRLPPHMGVLAKVYSVRHPFVILQDLEALIRRASIHLQKMHASVMSDSRSGSKVFIGHGRSKLWKDLKDFVQDRLNLRWDEFNRVPIVGMTNIVRLSEMLDHAAVALLVLTAEDEQADGSMQARMNVIHEVGLFQGRLGFHRAILLLEEGCVEFSNVQGLGQIRFPAGDITACFEEIRRFMEREELIA